MCEWLCYREWCDVQLVCGGRAFSAHRAVLASVSTFLRRLLLSCPTDESPTFIVLPDFDLEAMSAVLYYIYNGEVMVKTEKIEKFLDIIKAMQIFIDSQYVPEIAQTYKLDLHLDTKTDIISKRTFKLEFSGSRDQRYVNLKKGNEIQYSVSNSDCEDKLVRTLNPSKEPESLGDLKSPYEDRQRNYFLRDLYIETYPRNGNVNGLTAGVLAISNECYRTPGSMSLLTNANGKHLSDDDALNETASYSNKVLSRHDVKSYKIDEDETTKSNAASCLSIQTVEKSRISKSIHETQLLIQPKNTLMNKVQTPSSNRLFPILPQFYDPYVDFRISSSMYDSMKSLEEMRNKSASLGNTLLGDNSKDTNQSSRVTILNHVLESPWCPRIPNNYKPFRRKVAPVISSDQKNNERSHNDDNNNIDESRIQSRLRVDKTLVVSEKKELTELSNLSDCVSDEFKCNVCNQIFTSNESLTTHMRRHSSTARYSCGECTKTFSQLRNFKYHMSIHKGTKEFAATCTVCGKYFNDRGYLSSHMKIHRNRKEYKCTQCPKSFNQRVAYNMHVRIHTGVKPHVCEECGKAFSRKMLLKQHQRTHSGERPYACPHCDKRFADRSNMTLHLRLHTGVKPFSCTLCPKSFTKKHHLKSHLNFHTGSKPYSCPRCKLAFTQSSNMRTHLKKCRAPIAENEN